MKLTIEFEREDETRWIAEVVELPGVIAYGSSRAEASTRVRALALARVADMVAHGELDLPPSQREELDRRIEEMEGSNEPDLSWDEVVGPLRSA